MPIPSVEIACQFKFALDEKHTRQTSRGHPRNNIMFKSKEASPPPPPYSPLISYPEEQPLSYGHPHPATSGTLYYPVAPPTTAMNVSVQNVVSRIEYEEPSCICQFCREIWEAICFRICIFIFVLIIVFIGLAITHALKK